MERIFYIALNTYRELVRGKVLYSILFFGIILVGVISLFASVTVGDQARVVKDFGLFAISLQTVLFMVISGAAFLSKEINKRTIWTTLAKAVGRTEFMLGKFFGMLAVSYLLVFGSLLLLGMFLFLLQGTVDFSLLWYGILICLELLLLGAIVMAVSSFLVTPLLVGVVSFGLFLAGRSVEYLEYLVREELVGGAAASCIKIIYWIIPRFSDLNLSGVAINGVVDALSPSFFLYAVVYSAGYTLGLLAMASYIFGRREFP